MSYLIEKLNNIDIILSIILVIVLIYLTEVGAYVWHRFGTHDDFVPTTLGVQETHDKHHTDSEVTGGAADFFYVAIMLLLFAIVLGVISKVLGLSYVVYFLIYIPVLSVFLWNWYIHDAYHTRGHWLQRYDWFIKDRQIHFEHHYQPDKNYGIASHFSDMFFGTFANGKFGRSTDEELYFKE